MFCGYLILCIMKDAAKYPPNILNIFETHTLPEFCVMGIVFGVGLSIKGLFVG